MYKSNFAAMLLILLSATSASSWAGREGVDYIVDADSLVLGGSHYWPRTQNPEDLRTLYLEQPDTRERKVLHRSEGVLSDVQGAPQGSLVGVVERLWEENVSPERATYIDRRINEDGNVIETYYFEESKLIVLTLGGAVLDTILDVRRFAWSPEGDQVAYITGKYAEDGLEFMPTGTWIYDVPSKQVERIYTGGVDIQWALWDGNVYVYDPFGEGVAEAKVFRFEVGAGRLVPTSHKGIYFSPDGQYYYAKSSEGTGVRVFRTDDDAQVSVDLSSPSDATRVSYRVAGWLEPATLIVPSPLPGDQGDYLYDLATGTVRHSTGAVVPAKLRDGRLLVIQGGSVVERSLSTLALQ